MARWGQGDPRWIVEDRPDSVNVNNWHWREKSADKWSEQFFRSALNNLAFKDAKLSGKITEVSSINGDSTVSNRKGKLIYIYDYELELKWEAGDSHGTMHVANVAHDTRSKEFLFDIRFSDDDPSEEAVENLLKTNGVDAVRQALDKYPKALMEYAKDVVLPTRDSSDVGKEQRINVASVGPVSTETAPGLSVTKFEEISLEDKFRCTFDDLFNMLTAPELVNQWTRGNCQRYEPKEGGEFIIYDQNIAGHFLKLDRDSGVIEMSWRFKSWPAGFQSKVQIKLIQEEDGVRLELHQSKVPQYFVDNTKEGWRRAYFEPIKMIIGHSSPFGSY